MKFGRDGIGSIPRAAGGNRRDCIIHLSRNLCGTISSGGGGAAIIRQIGDCHYFSHNFGRNGISNITRASLMQCSGVGDGGDGREYLLYLSRNLCRAISSGNCSTAFVRSCVEAVGWLPPVDMRQ